MWSIVQHVPWEGPGLIADVLAERGIEHCIHRLGSGDPLPSADGIDGLVVMGGPMGVYEADRFPHIPAEIALLRAALARDLPVLGICLGAQLMAAALGARVFKGPVLEAGEGTVRLTRAGAEDPVMSAAGDDIPVVHWHHDTYPLPDGAVLLATSNLYAQQAFRTGRRAYGWQFHPEVTPAMAAEWRAHGLAIGDAHVMRVVEAGRKLVAAFVLAIQ